MGSYDVFISHAHADRDWVHVLAENLRSSGLEVFLDAWEIAEGDVLVHELDRGLRDSLHGVLVVSPASMTRPWVRQEYAVLLGKAVEQGRRLIPVLLADAEMPPMLASRLWIDFRGADGSLYEEQVRRLVRALEGEKPGPPPRGSGIQPPPGSGYRAAGPIRARLVIDRAQSTFHGSGDPVSADVQGIDHGTEERLWKLFDAFERRPREEVRKDDDAPGRAAESLLYRRQIEAGEALGRAFLPGPVAEAVRAALGDAERSGVTLELGLEITGEKLMDLPWETLRFPEVDGPPLALHPNVHLYRAIGVKGAAVTWSIPGPLRILVAIGSPEAQNDRGELLDMEAELERILDAVEPARRRGKAWVRVLERGTLRAIRAALEAERYHVLHLSCHAGPGVLILEDEDGREDRVTTERLCEEAIPPGRGVPLVVLAGCSTARGGKTKEGEEERLTPGLARGLLEHGVPVVLAMQASVGDRYATRLGGALYGALATGERPEPLRALSRARQVVELERGVSATPAELAEWSVPVLFLRTPERGTTAVDLPLYDPSVPFEEIEQAEEVRLARGVVVRRVGEFVGRRRDQRQLLRILRDPDSAGAVIRGLGGVGKSTLVAEVAQTLARDGWLVVSRFGEVSPEGILEEVGTTLFSIAIAQQADEKHPLRQVANVLRQLNLEWPDRLRFLVDHVLGAMSVLLLLDNFEDNLSVDNETAAFKNEQLAEFLGSWLAQPRKSRLLVTCRYPVPWAEDGGQAVDWHLGPLSLAETRKLIWRLPGLDALEPDEQQRAYADVGGHPRALEYLDALLRGGEARFRDVAQRMEKQLASRGIEKPREWMREQGGGLDRALAEAVTLAVDDVLLGQLLEGLAGVPLASRLVLGASVYRVPVGEVALRWQAGEIPELPGETEKEFPELPEPTGFAEAREALERAGLLAPFLGSDEGARRYSVHRWTAGALAKRASADELTEVHRRAACYWRWRSMTVTRNLEEVLEARYHHRLAGELDAAVLVTESVCLQLETWGAYSLEEQLIREVLIWIPERSEKAAAFIHHLGIVAQVRGLYGEALDLYRDSLRIKEKLGDRAGMASSYHQLGIVAQLRGSYEEALDWYRKAFRLAKELGDRAGLASTYHQMGRVAHERSSYEEALDWYRKALQIHEELRNRAGMSSSYNELGRVAQARGSYDEALDWYRKALQIHEALGDRAGMANFYQNMGNIQYLRGSYDEALDWYRKAFRFSEELGYRASMANSCHQMGMVAQARGSYDEALDWYRKSLRIFEELGNRAGMASSYHQVGRVAQARGSYDEALDWYRKSLRIEEELGNRAGVAASYGQMGSVAQDRSSYDDALGWYRKSLPIFEELGDRASMAISYGQMGIVAQVRGSYDEALDWYRKSLLILEELGNRAGMASLLSQMGVLFTERGAPEEAVSLNVRSLALRLELRVPQVGIDLHWLGRQRAALGEDRFRELVVESVGEESLESVLGMLDEDAASQDDASAAGAKGKPE